MVTVSFHATSLMIDGKALLIAGRSGSGKSDLALRLIDRGARLIADDYTLLEPSGDSLYAKPPQTIAGRIELRGIGIVDLEHAEGGPVTLLLDLDSAPQRLPDERLPDTLLCGIAIPTLGFAPFEASAAIKAEHAMRRFGGGAAA